jgi:hypothetical protein
MTTRFAYKRAFSDSGVATQMLVNTQLAMIFTTGPNIYDNLTVYVYFNRVPDNGLGSCSCRLSIKAVDGSNLPTGEDIDSDDFNLNSAITYMESDNFETYRCTALIDAGGLEASTNYALVFRTTMTPGVNQYNNVKFSNTYWTPPPAKDSGTLGVVAAAHSTDGGSSWEAADRDIYGMNFEIFGQETGGASGVTTKHLVTGLRHVWRPGSYRLEMTFGGVSTTPEIVMQDVDIPTGTKEGLIMALQSGQKLTSKQIAEAQNLLNFKMGAAPTRDASALMRQLQSGVPLTANQIASAQRLMPTKYGTVRIPAKSVVDFKEAVIPKTMYEGAPLEEWPSSGKMTMSQPTPKFTGFKKVIGDVSESFKKATKRIIGGAR